MLLREVDEKYLSEAPMGMLDRLGSKIASYVPGDIGRQAQGKLDTGDTANSLRNDFYTYLGASGTKPTKQNVLNYLKSQGLPTTTASSVVQGNLQDISKSDIDKMFLAAVRDSKTYQSSTPSTNTSPSTSTTSQPSSPANKLSSVKSAAAQLSTVEKRNLINYIIKTL
jgi:hypothetical protein